MRTSPPPSIPAAAAPPRTSHGALARACYTVLQVALLIAIWYGCDRAAAWLHLPFSGGVVGLLLMVALLLGGVVRPSFVDHGAEWLLSNMLLFFIPLIVSVVQFTQVLEREGVRLFAAIGIGFLSVLMVTALTVEWVCRLERGLRLRKLLQQRGARPPRGQMHTQAQLQVQLQAHARVDEPARLPSRREGAVS